MCKGHQHDLLPRSRPVRENGGRREAGRRSCRGHLKADRPACGNRGHRRCNRFIPPSLQRIRRERFGPTRGTFKVSFGDTAATLGISDARFARDVAVSGRADYGFESQAIDGSVTVDGPGAEDGKIDISGVWFGFGPPIKVFKIDGTIGGRTVALTVPAP